MDRNECPFIKVGEFVRTPSGETAIVSGIDYEEGLPREETFVVVEYGGEWVDGRPEIFPMDQVEKVPPPPGSEIGFFYSTVKL